MGQDGEGRLALWPVCGSLPAAGDAFNARYHEFADPTYVTSSGPKVSIAPPFIPPRTIVLVGLMGAGKTNIGRRLAARLGLPFIDADAEIEAAAGETIEEIFKRCGEGAFRDGERRVIARLLDGPIHVLATGGGAFMDAQT